MPLFYIVISRTEIKSHGFFTHPFHGAPNMDCRNIHGSDLSFLEHSIEILIVEDMIAECDVYQGFLSSYKLYNVTCVSTAQEANALLLEKRFHVCLMDLGICDINGDEYYLLKTFSARLPFIVVTGKDSLEHGFKTKKLGAFAAVKKPVDFQNLDLIQLINEAILYGIFKYATAGNFKRVIIDAMNVFIEIKPKNLRCWTEKVGVDERYFRRIWTECFGNSPRMVFILYRAFLEVFDRYNMEYSKEFKNPAIVQLANVKNKNKRLQGIFKRHKKEMAAMVMN